MTEEKLSPSLYLLCPQRSEGRQEGGGMGSRLHPPSFPPPVQIFPLEPLEPAAWPAIPEWMRLKCCMDFNLFIMKNLQIYTEVECNELSRVHQTSMSINILAVLFHSSFLTFILLKTFFCETVLKQILAIVSFHMQILLGVFLTDKSFFPTAKPLGQYWFLTKLILIPYYHMASSPHSNFPNCFRGIFSQLFFKFMYEQVLHFAFGHFV